MAANRTGAGASSRRSFGDVPPRLHTSCVVHYSGFSGFWQCGPVEEVSFRRFAAAHPVRIVDHDGSTYSPHEIVHRARSRIGENDYRLLTNNCEHFCNWCLCGVSRSAQVDRRWQLPIRLLAGLFHA